MHKNTAKIIEEAKLWGLGVVFVDGADECLNAPFSLSVGLDWKKKILYLRNDCLKDAETGNHALHELGHFAIGLDPDKSDEVADGVLAFEFYVAKRLGLYQWNKSMEDYGIKEDGTAWGDATPKEKAAVVAESLVGALKRGILDQDHNPTYKRFKR